MVEQHKDDGRALLHFRDGDLVPRVDVLRMEARQVLMRRRGGRV